MLGISSILRFEVEGFYPSEGAG